MNRAVAQYEQLLDDRRPATEDELKLVRAEMLAACDGDSEVIGELEEYWSIDDTELRLPGTDDLIEYIGNLVLTHPPIGEGAFGTVYKARQLSFTNSSALESARWVAVKVIQSQLDKGEQQRFAIERLRREVDLLSRLHHPNIVVFYDSGEDDGRPYFSMEYANNGSLFERLKTREGALTPIEAVRHIERIADAVTVAHDQGIIHRDIKPENILLNAVGDSEVAKLADFGLGRLFLGKETAVATAGVVGTLAYMSPEQTDADAPVGVYSDIYSLGATLYHLVTGDPPFRGSQAAVLRSISEETPVAPSKHLHGTERSKAEIPWGATWADLDAICLKCLEKQPRHRYQSARQLQADLKRWLSGRPTDARPLGFVARMWRWCIRNRVIASLILAVALTLLIGTVTSTLMWLRAEAAIELAEQRFAKLEAVSYAKTLRLASQARARGDIQWKRYEEQSPPHLIDWEHHYVYSDNHLGIQNVAPFTGVAAALTGGRVPATEIPAVQAPKVPATSSSSVVMGSMSHALMEASPTGLLGFSADGRYRLWTNTQEVVLSSIASENGGTSLPIDGVDSAIHALTCSNDGTLIAAGAADGSLFVWPKPSAPSSRIETGLDAITSVSINESVERIACGHADGSLSVWEYPSYSRTQLLENAHRRSVTALTFDREGKHLFSAGVDGNVRTWRIADRLSVKSLELGHVGIWSCQFSRYGSYLAWTTGNALQLFNRGGILAVTHCETGVTEVVTPLGRLPGTPGSMFSVVAVGEDGNTVLRSQFQNDLELLIPYHAKYELIRTSSTSWEQLSGQAARVSPTWALHTRLSSTYPIEPGDVATTYAEDSTHSTSAVGTHNGNVLIIDATISKLKTMIRVSHDPVGVIGFTSQNRLVVYSANEISLWDTDSKYKLQSWRSSDDLEFMKLNGGRLVAGTGARFTILDSVTLQPIRTIETGLEEPLVDVSAAVSTSGHIALAYSWGRVAFWDARKLKREDLVDTRQNRCSIAFNETGTRLVTVDSESIALWDTNTGIEVWRDVVWRDAFESKKEPHERPQPTAVFFDGPNLVVAFTKHVVPLPTCFNVWRH